MNKLLSYSNLVHAMAGATGSAIAIAVFYPLDTARTRLQVDDHRKAKFSAYVLAEIAKEEGISSWYRGVFSVVSTLCCSNFVYFYAYNSLKLLFQQNPNAIQDLIFAFISGVINVLVTTPLWVVNTRLKLQGAKFRTENYDRDECKYNGIFDALYKVFRNEGLGALWSGTMPSVILVSNPAIQFMVYEALKRYCQRLLMKSELSGVLYFLIGAIAKMVATIVSYPMQIVQSRLRAGIHKSKEPSSIWETFTSIIRMGGVQGLFKGLEAKLIQTVLTAAMMFLLYEKIAAFVFKIMGYETIIQTS